MKSGPEQLERIVAYLDGELSADESAQVEQRLASDEGFRQELQSAERAWSALDELPMAHVGDEFANTTMDMVVDAARQDIQQQTLVMPIQQRKQSYKNAIIVAAAVLLTALAVRQILQTPNRRLIADLPVIQNVNIYSQLESIEYLRLVQSKLGDDVASYSLNAEQVNHKLDEFKLISDPDQRAAWLVSLDDSERTSLRGKESRFRDLPDEKKQSLRDLNAAITADSQQEQLVQTMHVYQQWLNDLEPSEQYELREKPLEEKAAAAVRGIKRTSNDQRFKLTDEELRDLFKKVFPFIANLRKAQQPKFDREFERMSPRERMEFFMMPGPDQIRRAFQLLKKESPEQFEMLDDLVLKSLPTDISQEYQALSERQKMEQLRAWAWELRMLIEKQRREGPPGRSTGMPSEAELQSFFVDELEPDERERLLALPQEQMKQQLVSMLQGKRRRSDRQRQGARDGRRMESQDGPLREGRGNPRWRDRQGPPPRDGRGPRGFDGGPEGPPPEGPPPEFGPPRGRPFEDFGDREQLRRRRRRVDGPFRQGPPPPEEPTTDEVTEPEE